MNPLPEPPAWGLAVGQIGAACVVVGLLAFVLAAVASCCKRPLLGPRLFLTGTIFSLLAFGAHIALLLGRQFEFAYVYANTRDAMSFAYRLSAAWAAQEGSFLLWIVASAVLASLVARRTASHRHGFTLVASIVLAGMLGIVVFESPFRLIELHKDLLAALPKGQTLVLPPDGTGLNPVLENYWMVIHPWVIFTGFGSLLSLFAWAVAAAFSRDWASWARAARPWAIFSATVLGVGLTMGGLWAYETLGWGGFWAWDPVENVSLVPFLAATVLVHTLYVQANRARWARWNLILACLPFVWFAYGTYLTRSGVLTNVSVHSFATINEKARILLVALVVGSAVATLAVAAAALFRKGQAGESQPAGHRTMAMGWGMAAVYTVALIAAFGMSFPFLTSLFGKPPTSMGAGGGAGTVTEDFYNRVVLWAFVPALLLMGVAPLLGWTKTLTKSWTRAGTILYVSAALLCLAMVPVMKHTLNVSPWSMLAILISVWACTVSVVSNVMLLVKRRQWTSMGAFLAHIGVSVLLLGLVVSHAFEKTSQAAVTSLVGGELASGPLRYSVRLTRKPTADELLTPENRVPVQVVDVASGAHSVMWPTVYYAPSANEGEPPMLIARPAIRRTPLYDVYLAVNSRETSLPEGLVLGKGESGTVTMDGGLTPIRIAYVDKVVTGMPGSPGSTFGVKLQISYRDQTLTGTPEIVMQADGMEHRDLVVGKDFGVRLEALQAEDGTATLSVMYPEPIFVMELFFKPLTILVWIGLGIMTLGGALAIRRLRE